jgi:type VI secretion system protein ImpJ
MEKEHREIMWTEGMFLLPHHLQFANRNVDTKLRQATEHLMPFNWGFRHLEIDAASLKNYLLAVRSCQVVTENGTQLSMPGNLDLDPRSFKEGLAGSTEFLDVFLGVPMWRPDSPNTMGEGDDGGALERRYRMDETEVVDENLGENPRPLQIKRFRGRIFWSTEDTTGYETVQIARIKMSPSGETTILDPNYIPPVMDIRAWPPLLAICEDMNNALAMANYALVRDFADREITELLGMPRGLEAAIKMIATNSYVASLGQMCKTPNLHPYLIYLELLRLAATLGLFRGKRTAPAHPDYAHDDLAKCFLGIKEVLDSLMDRIGTSTFLQRSFQVRNDRLEVDLEEDWVSGMRLLYLGVSGEDDISQLEQKMSRLKICAPRDFSAVIQRRLGGVGIRRLRRVPAALPERAGTSYFQISMAGDFWRSIEEDKTIAIVGAEELDYSFTLYVV